MKVSKALHGAFASLYQVMVKGISAVEPLAKCDGSEGTREALINSQSQIS